MSIATDDEITAEFIGIIREITGIRPTELTSDKAFVDDLHIDSLTMVEIATAAEDHFGVPIPDSALSELKTIGDATAFVRSVLA